MSSNTETMTKQEQKTPISITFTGYGHWKISTTYRRATIEFTTTNSQAVDNFKDDDSRTHNKGFNALRSEAARQYAAIAGHY